MKTITKQQQSGFPQLALVAQCPLVQEVEEKFELQNRQNGPQKRQPTEQPRQTQTKKQ